VNQLNQILARLRSRQALIALAVVLLLLNIGRLAINKYFEYYKDIESKQALLSQYQISTRNIATVRSRLQQIKDQEKKIDSLMFTGNSRREITSAMQIKIQELLSSSGLSPESLRPSSQSAKDEDNQYSDIVVKTRLTGNFENFIQFLKKLYTLDYLFKIENFTIQPFKNSELKIFLELKGFYRLTTGSEKNNSDT
jgi:Tfp pilus assembly protein PilO